ncbi:MAG: tetratricopeptide repeat protein [Leptolyngbyaceae cyanobacterium RM1_405_57]|nr:tetratricopeptide repeat protein [Leptolyngbyaceae cyanobacterium RM1_405_57]
MRFSYLGWATSLALSLTVAPLTLPTIPTTQIFLPFAAAQTAVDQFQQAGLLIEQGNQQTRTSQYQAAIQSYQQALEIYQSADVRQAFSQESRAGEADALGNLGVAHRSLSQYQRAIDYYQQALSIHQEVGDRNSEGVLLADIGRLYVAQNSPQSAIQQLQSSVEVRESIRAELRQLPPETQQAFTDSVANDYRLLAELLRQQNRNQEAQAILNLLEL